MKKGLGRVVRYEGVLETNKNKFRFEPKQTETRSVSRLFRFVSWNQKEKIPVCFGVSNLYWNNRNKQNCFKTNRNKPKKFSTEHLQLQPGLHSCWQTRPGASQSSCRQTRTGAAKILADRQVQVQHKAPVGRHIQVQRKALVDRHLYVECGGSAFIRNRLSSYKEYAFTVISSWGLIYPLSEHVDIFPVRLVPTFPPMFSVYLILTIYLT